MITAFTSARYVLVALLRSVSPEKFPVGSRSRVKTAVVRCLRFVSIMADVIGTAMLVILSSLRRSKGGRSRKSDNSGRCGH